MQQNYNKKRKLNRLKASLLMLLMTLFSVHAMAQNVYMHTGTQTVPGTGSLNFYDSGGPSSPDYWWEKWYSHNENATLVFKNGTSPILVTFNQFTAYDGDNGADIGQYSLRINDDHLYVYEGEGENASKLIVDLTGTIDESFSIMANGPITFKFVSNGSYREEGWAASVSSAATYVVQQPIIIKDECEDAVVLYPMAYNATIYYTTNGSTPTASSTEYDGAPFNIDLSSNVTVKTIAVVEDQANSAVASRTFTSADQRPTPGVPTISINGNMVHITPAAVPAGLNETYNVRYTVDGTEPSANNGTLITSPWNAFEWQTPNTTFKAVTVAVNCPDKVSAVVAETFGNVKVPTPVITFNANGTATISCSLTGATIYYSIDGSTPTTSSTLNGLTSVTTAALTPGATVKAIAHYASTGYVDSDVASSIYVPAGGSTVGGGIVLLDDREDHSWSYYSDETSPIKSLNPADVKITYFGNGTNNMTTAAQNGDNPTAFGANATGVQVNVGEPENQFIYLKTLENDDPEGEGDEYSYSMIPNPFQVRPVGASGTTQTPTRTLYISGTVYGNNQNQRFIRVTYTDENNHQQTWERTNTGAGNTTIIVKAGTTITLTARGRSFSWDFDYNYSTISARYDDDYSTAAIGTVTATSLNYNTSPYANQTYSINAATITIPGWRGFYAWRVKRLGGGLSIQRANGTTVNEGGIINAEEDIKFITSNPEGNEVEFEALWAQAYVTNSTNTSGLNSNVSYERNFMVLGSDPGSTSSTAQWPTTTSNTTTDGANLPIYRYSANYQYSLTQQIYTPEQVGAAGTITQIAFYVATNQSRNRTLRIYLEHTGYNAIQTNDNNAYVTFPIADNVAYSGTQNFNATGWHTITLTTPFYYDGSSNLLLTVCDDSNSNHSTVFRTYSSGGTRAVYVGWDSATDPTTYYYPADGTSTYNNQIRFTKAISNLAGINVPLTITTYNPDGTGGSTSVTLSDAINCGADLKFENIKMNAIPTINGDGHNLALGRGITPATTNGLCATSVFGYNTSSDVTANVAFKNRIESGNYGYVRLLNAGDENTHVVTGTPDVHFTLGSDYDRATSTNGLLITYDYTLGYGLRFTGSNPNYNITVKSGTNGTFGSNTNGRFYMGFDLIPTIDSHISGTYNRHYTILGGVFTSDFAGGINGYMGPTTDPSLDANYVRINGGTFTGRTYMAGTRLPGYGNRYMIATGGTFSNFITGGCYGYDANSGITYGSTNIYFGGKANQSSTLGLFGSGYGSTAVYGTSDEDSYYVTATNVVVADQANVAGNVFGGGNNGYALNGSDVYVLGGTIAGNVFGGSNQSKGSTINVYVKGGTITGSVYGGSDTKGVISQLATVNVSGGTMSNVFGGGYGSATDMAAGTKVIISNGTINNNVYGGGEEGTVSAGGTEVNISGGTMKDVYGAGKGATNQPALVTGQTKVNISGGTIANVYGGGEAGNITNGTNLASVVTVSSGTISGDVFGGGKMGTTTGAVTTTVSGGNIRGNVFGGAEGEHKKVFVTGLRTVNMTGGHVYGNVYGGSRNANDGNDLNLSHNSFGTSTETSTISVTNISGGIIDQNVYAAGYYGNTFGSVYAFIGKNAIENAPHKSPTTGVTYSVKTLNILGAIWAGGDWGTFSGTFGGPTISGNSNIYVDGTNYETTTTQTSNAQYMNIGGSILGCGTSCDAGKAERIIMIRNYGTDISSSSKDEPYTEATRSLLSIQRAKLLVFDNAHLNLNGQGMVNSLGTTEKYGIYEIANTGNTTNNNFTEDLNYGVRLVNGSSIYLNTPVSQISNFISASCADVYTASLTNGYTPLTPSDLGSIDNKVRVNGGNYVEVKYGNKYCMLKGYAHMMVSTNDSDATCAYARPRWETNAPFGMNDSSYDNRDDGGWVSYTASKNKFDLAGTNPVNLGVQMAYENHTHRNGEDYYRIWRDGDIEHYREGVFNAHATGTTAFKTTDVTITLPPLRDRSFVYRFETVGTGENTSINYGADIMAYDAARATGTGDDWISYTTNQQSGQTQAQVQSLINEGIMANPDVNFGLVVLPTAGLGLTGDTYLISQNSDNNLASYNTQFTNNDFTKDDQVTFRLTYYDKLSSNMTWDPMTIVLVQVDPQHPDVVLDRVTISLAVNTSTTITQEFTTTLYAVMQGKGSTSDTYTAKVTLPNFTVVSGQESTFTVNSVTFTHQDGTSTSSPLGVLVSQGDGYDLTRFAVTYGAAMNYDNTNGWASTTGQNHDANNTNNVKLGTTGGRSEFAIDFTLHYNGHESITTTDTLGLLTFNLTFDYFVDENGVTQMNQPLNIQVYVIRRGEGTKFYLDGINGSNTYDGKHPDQAALSLSTIFNRLGYLAGDEIYIVNKVTIDKQTTWNGSTYDNVLIYRYDGGHELATAEGIIGNSDNEAYLDTLVYVTHSLVMTGITLDGHYNNGENQIQVGVDEHNDPVYAPFTPVTAAAPMIAVANGAGVELNEGTVLRQNNNNSTDGGAVYVADGGTLMMNANAAITDNKTAGNGGGVYMAGILNVSDDIQIYNNKKGTAQNNVYLMGDEKVVTIGTGSTTDAYGALSASAKIGVTKSTSGEYTKVVHVDSEGDVEWLDTPMPRPNSIIFHDANIYQLERYDDITYLYWVGTWVTTVTWNPYYESREATGYTNYMTAAQLKDIQTPQQLAWVISMANGENGCTAQSGMVVEIQKDIDMDASIWVPIGTTAHPFDGTFEGNGHLIEGVHSSLVHNNMGVFGTANGIVKNTVFKVDFDANSTNMGTVAGTMTGGTISNVEAAGTLKGGSLTKNMGSLVGVSASGSTIHSSFAVNAMTGVATTVMGGLVGTNGGDLFNSYANTDMNVSEHIGGLVGDNNGHVENCYVVVGVNDFPLFAKTNSSTGIIKYCYADKAGTYIGTDENTTTPQPTLSGNYSAVVDRKTLGYMYGDNIVTAPGNGYVKTTHEYVGKHAILWDGLLSVLNQWVNDGHTSYTKWYRPITQNINGDLPVLAFSKANCMATVGNDKKFLDYSNDLDQLLETYGGQTANIFLYGNAVDVENVPGTNVNVFINEDAVLLQADGADPFINATVGVTFDNSCKSATDFFGAETGYDWHFLSSPLTNAQMGITYTGGDDFAHGDAADYLSMVNNYLPDNPTCSWDLYSFYEPEYHWINMKRSANNHWHFDDPFDQIVYEQEDIFVPGKGYMAAIEQDSYLNNTGTLNKSNFDVDLTYASHAPGTDELGYNLVGNPYMAYLNMDAFAAANQNFGSYWVYVAESNNYVPGNSMASTNSALPSVTLHPHQAFFVKASGAGQKVSFNYNMATASPNPNSYYRSERIDYPLVNLKASNERGMQDLAVIEFNRPEMGGSNKLRALNNASFELCSHMEGEDYSILFAPEGTERVPVRFRTKEDGTFTLTWETMHGEFSSLLLVDNMTGTVTDMLRADRYTFDAGADDYASRFYITYRVTDVEEHGEGDGTFAWFDGSEWIVEGQGVLDVVDVMGRTVYSERLVNESNRVGLNGVAKGVYLLRVSDGTNTMVQKIVVR